MDPASRPRGPLPGSTNFSNFDGPGVIYVLVLYNFCLHDLYLSVGALNCMMSLAHSSRAVRSENTGGGGGKL